MLSIPVILFLQIILAISLAIIFSREIDGKFKVGVLELALGFYSLILITNLVAWVGHARIIYGVFLIGIVIALFFKIRNFQKILFDSSFFLFFFVGITTAVLVYLGHGVGLEYRLFINPDPNGYGVVTGAVQSYETFPNLLNQFEKYTGVPFSYQYNWDKPNPLSLLDSPWHIPDSLIKYGIANGFYLHNGISFLAIPFLSLVGNPIQSFSIIWAFWSVIGTSLIISTFFLITKTLLNKFMILTRKDSLKILSVTLFISSGVFFLLIFILEGFANQLISLAQTLTIYLAGLKYIEFKTRKSIVQGSMFILIIFVSGWFTYAQQIPFLIFACLIGILGGVQYQQINKISTIVRRNILKTLIFVSVLTASSIALFQTQGIQEAFKALTKSAGGGALHLGAVNPFSAIGLSLSNPISILKNIGDLNRIELTQMVWPNSAYDNLGWNLVQQGYQLNMSSMVSLKFCLILIISAGILVMLIRSTRKFTLLVLLSAPFVALSYFYLYIRSGNYLKQNQSALFSDYVWLRLLSILGIFTVPLLITIFSYFLIEKDFNKSSKKSFNFNIKNVVALALVILTFFRLADIYQISKSHIKNSQLSYISSYCPSFLFKEKSPFLITQKIVPELSLGVCGRELNFLTDSFPVKIDKTDSPRDVIDLRMNLQGKWEWADIGTLTITDPITTPCNINCVKSLSGFEPKTLIKYSTFAKQRK